MSVSPISPVVPDTTPTENLTRISGAATPRTIQRMMDRGLVFEGQAYEIGDKVSILSVSNNQWFDDGVIIDIDRRGQLKVSFNKKDNRLTQHKWISREKALTMLKKRLDEDICTNRTVVALLNRQLRFLDKMIRDGQEEMKTIAERVLNAKKMKMLVAGEVAKISEGEDIVKKFKSMEGLHVEEIIEHKEVKSLKVIGSNHSVSRISESMILALRWSILRAKREGDLIKKDFTQIVDAYFPEKGAGPPYYTPAHKLGEFSFKDYSPRVFRNIRKELSGVSEIQYVKMIADNQKFLEFVSNSRSGAFFFFSHNGRFMIKTISKAECQFLRDNMKEYYDHLMANKRSMIAKVYGLHRVKISGVSLKFVVMESIFYSSVPKYVHLIFDLKGSRGQTRRATAKDFNRAPTKKFTSTVLKDNDFVDREIAVKIGSKNAKQVTEILKADVEFLERLKVVDYSLLLGVHYSDKPVPTDGKPFRLGKYGEWDSCYCAGDSKTSLMQSSGRGSLGSAGDRVSLSSDITRGNFDIKEQRSSRSLTNKTEPNRSSPSINIQLGGTRSAPSVSRASLENSGTPEIETYMTNKNIPPPPPPRTHDRNIWKSKDGKTIYYIGLIDMLIQYGMKKQLEHTYKRTILGGSDNDISVIPPEKYAKRFLDFILPRIV